jgi:hypothetical protein
MSGWGVLQPDAVLEGRANAGRLETKKSMTGKNVLWALVCACQLLVEHPFVGWKKVKQQKFRGTDA